MTKIDFLLEYTQIKLSLTQKCGIPTYIFKTLCENILQKFRKMDFLSQQGQSINQDHVSMFLTIWDYLMAILNLNFDPSLKMTINQKILRCC